MITGNRIFDLGGLSSYSIDLPNGGNATISNNVIQQSAVNGNNIILEYGAEGLTNPGRTVSIDHNTIINNAAGGKLLLNASTTPYPLPTTSCGTCRPAYTWRVAPSPPRTTWT